MIKLFGAEYTKDELLTRVGDVSQVGGVRLSTLGDGVERGVRTANFRTGSGLDFTVLVDRGMDISTATFNGQSLAWRSPTGDVHPAYYVEKGLEWLRSFYGGLVVTCGLTYAGAPTVDKGKELGLHGRVSNTPASNVYADAEWQDGSYVMWVQGKVRETSVFGENVQMTRRISARLGEPRIWIHDKVTNLGATETEHMMLYHCNIGFPALDAGAKLVAPVANCMPRDDEAATSGDLYASMPAPQAGWNEKVYYLDIAPDSEGYARAAVVNPGFGGGQGFGVYLRYPKKELPKFIEWKMPGVETYVVGMEPANCWVEGRDKEREAGTLQFLQPGETREYHLEIGVLSSQEDIAAYEQAVKDTGKG